MHNEPELTLPELRLFFKCHTCGTPAWVSENDEHTVLVTKVCCGMVYCGLVERPRKEYVQKYMRALKEKRKMECLMCGEVTSFIDVIDTLELPVCEECRRDATRGQIHGVSVDAMLDDLTTRS